MKKILLAILTCFIGIVCVSAAPTEEIERLKGEYNKTKGLYCDVGILNCYDINLLNKTYKDNETAAEQCLNQFSRGKCNGHISLTTDKIFDFYKRSGLGYTLSGVWSLDYNYYIKTIDTLNSNVTFDSKLKATQATMEIAAKNLDQAVGSNSYVSDAKDMVSSMNSTYASMCEYLRNHQGIRDYVKMVIDIVCYAALAAGIILGIMDFVKAIASHEDAALTKAFQSFMKRVIAIALIFLSNVFVTLILSVVQRNDYLNMARENATCFTDEVIKSD